MNAPKIGAWKLISETGVGDANHPEAVRAEVSLAGRRVGSVIRRDVDGGRVYTAGFGDCTVGKFPTLAGALDAIATKAAPGDQAPRRAPLLLVSCSATKRPTVGPVPFVELYDGPMWRQVRASSVASSAVAALSAEHGYLAPDSAVVKYDRQITEARVDELAAAGGAALVDAIEQNDDVRVFGGELYRRLVRTALAGRPDLLDRVTFATGSFLKQRRQLGETLRSVGEGR